jgi:hypothetical protein
MLVCACSFVLIYTLVDMVMGFLSLQVGTVYQLDSTLTSEVFSFAKWVVVSGAAITVAKTAKGDTNSDEDESEGDFDES